MTATLVILAHGAVADAIARVADERAELDRTRRQVLHRGDSRYPPSEMIASWLPCGAAVMLREDNTPEMFLDEQRATSTPWMEDAFLRTINGRG